MVECFSFNPSSCKFNFCYCFSFFFWGMNQSWDTSCSKNRLHCLDISHLSFARVCIPLFYGIDPIYRPQGSIPSSVVSFLYFFSNSNWILLIPSRVVPSNLSYGFHIRLTGFFLLLWLAFMQMNAYLQACKYKDKWTRLFLVGRSVYSKGCWLLREVTYRITLWTNLSFIPTSLLMDRVTQGYMEIHQKSIRAKCENID